LVLARIWPPSPADYPESKKTIVMKQNTTGEKTLQEFLPEDREQQERACPSPVAGVATAAGEKGRIHVLLVDDHPVMRQLISATLEEEADIAIIGEAADGKEAIDKARQLRPDLILMDLSMPVINGIEATRIIHSEFPHILIIGLSLYQEENRTAKMLEAGAATYVCKDELFEKLVAAIRQVSNPVPARTA
jgi:CheY-like chemotaxis protein